MIVVYEPQCTGPEHVEFNSALLTVVRLAFPAERILFLAERAHAALVRQRLERQGTNGVRFVVVRTQPRMAQPFKRLLPDYFAFRRTVRWCRHAGGKTILLSSITAEGLLALKIALLGNSRGLRLGAFFHAILESLANRPRRNPFARLLALRNAFRFHTPRTLKYVVLAKPFEESLRRILPTTAPNLMSIEHPYLFPPSPPEGPRRLQTPITFGTVGAAKISKGFGDWISFSRSFETLIQQGSLSFVHVGLVVDPELCKQPSGIRFVTTQGWTGRDEFEREIKALDYVVFPYPPGTYQLTAIGAFMDALSFGRPVIALRTPYFQHCFQQLGDIGYLCDTMDDMRDLMRSLVADRPEERYVQQQLNVFGNRTCFSPESVARTFVEQWSHGSRI